MEEDPNVVDPEEEPQRTPQQDPSPAAPTPVGPDRSQDAPPVENQPAPNEPADPDQN